MKRTNKNINAPGIEQFIKEFGSIISNFETGVELVMGLITGSFEDTKKESAEITSLFTQSRNEAEIIFSIFSGIAAIFSGGGGGFISSLLGLLPGGELISTLFGDSASPLHGNAGLSHTMYPAISNHAPAPVVIVNTQLEKAGMYRVYREGKIISESRP